MEPVGRAGSRLDTRTLPLEFNQANRGSRVLCSSTDEEQHGAKGKKPGVVRLIGVFRLIKALLLIALGCGALKFLHHDVATQIQNWLRQWHVDPDGHYLRALISKVAHVDDRNLVLISAATFFYAAVFLVEGIGLLMLKRWAEIMTVIVTASFIPLEIYHFIRHVSAMKIAAIVVNVAIVVYLIWRLKHEGKNTSQRKARHESP